MATQLAIDEIPRDLKEFRTIAQMVEEYPDMVTEHALRYALRYRDQNGLSQHVCKLGKQTLIHVPGFTSWLMRRI